MKGSFKNFFSIKLAVTQLLLGLTQFHDRQAIFRSTQKKIFLLFAGAALLFNACNASHPDSSDKSSSSTKKKAKKTLVHEVLSSSSLTDMGLITYNAVRRYRIDIDSTKGFFRAFTNYCDYNASENKMEFRTESENFEYAMGIDSLYLTRNNSTEVYFNKEASLNGRWEYVSTCENNECVGLPRGTSMSRIFTPDSMIFIVTWENYCFMDAYESFDVHPTTDAVNKVNCREGFIRADSTHNIRFRLESLTEKNLVYSYSLDSSKCTFELLFGSWTETLCNEADADSEFLGVGYRYTTNAEEFRQCMTEMYKQAGLSIPQL
jgi:hypothetical protein